MPEQNLSWDEAIQQVLREAGSALSYIEIAQRIADQQLRKVGANPNSSVAVHLSGSLQEPNSPFQRVARGQYALRESLRAPTVAATAGPVNSSDESKTGALRAFGMYWRRNLVNWEPTQPKLLGLQTEEATPVDFAEQVGVYLLHDRDRVIYVGRASDRMVVRLRAHTTDRLSGRWDRFSWLD